MVLAWLASTLTQTQASRARNAAVIPNFDYGRSAFRDFRGRWSMTVCGVRHAKAALSIGCKAEPVNAPAGCNRRCSGGNEVAEAFG